MPPNKRLRTYTVAQVHDLRLGKYVAAHLGHLDDIRDSLPPSVVTLWEVTATSKAEALYVLVEKLEKARAGLLQQAEALAR